MLLSADTILDEAQFNAMWVDTSSPVSLRSPVRILTFYHFSIQSGYSRFPVHFPGRPKAFIGLLLVKRVRICFETADKRAL